MFVRSDSSLKFVVNNGLSTGLNAGDIVTHWVQARLGWVHLDDGLESSFAAIQLFFEESALGFALFHDEWFGVFAVFEHLLDVLGPLNVRVVLRFVPDPAGGQKSCNSASHLFFSLFFLLLL